MTRLTEDLLMLARMDQNLRVTWENINLTELLQHLVNQLQTQAVAKNLTMICQPMSSLMIKGNSEQILRLFTNLLENAIYYTPANGQIVISANTSGQWITINIKDTGIGIASEQIGYIFDRFWRADTSRSQWTGGSGLGLAIARSITESHGGNISVTSQLALGSCFTVRLPVTKS